MAYLTITSVPTTYRTTMAIITVNFHRTYNQMYRRFTTLQMASPSKNTHYHELPFRTSMQYNNDEVWSRITPTTPNLKQRQYGHAHRPLKTPHKYIWIRDHPTWTPQTNRNPSLTSIPSYTYEFSNVHPVLATSLALLICSVEDSKGNPYQHTQYIASNHACFLQSSQAKSLDRSDWKRAPIVKLLRRRHNS